MVHQNVSEQTTETELHSVWIQLQDTTDRNTTSNAIGGRNNQEIKFLYRKKQNVNTQLYLNVYTMCELPATVYLFRIECSLLMLTHISSKIILNAVFLISVSLTENK